MLYKNYLIKRRKKKEMVMEFMFAALFGYVIYISTMAYKCDDPCTDTTILIGKSIMMPMYVVFFLPNLTFVTSRFILQQIVEDKQNKIRETLRLMSLSRFAYAFSYFLFQAIFAFIEGSIIGAFIFTGKD